MLAVTHTLGRMRGIRSLRITNNVFQKRIVGQAVPLILIISTVIVGDTALRGGEKLYFPVMTIRVNFVATTVAEI